MHKSINLCKIIFGTWAICLCCLLFGLKKEIWEMVMVQSGYVRLLEICILVLIVAEYRILSKNIFWSNTKKMALFIGGGAFGIRIIALMFSRYVPSTDFQSYFNGACIFATYGFKTELAYDLARFHIPAFGGQAVFNGILLRFLSPTLLGMQLLNIVYTSGICVLIYILGKEICRRAALIGAILYSFYPMSILSTQITTNHHGATFYILFGIFIYNCAVNEKKMTKRIIYIIASSTCLMISNCYHPSVIIVVCALLINALINEIEALISSPKMYFKELAIQLKYFKGRFCVTILTVILYGLLFSGAMYALKSCGYIDSAKSKVPWEKIIVGLNQETVGGWNQEDYSFGNSLSKEEKKKAYISVIMERICDPNVGRLMIEKTKNVWFRGDNYCYFYTLGIFEQIQGKLERTYDNVVREYYETLQEEISRVIVDINVANNVYIYCMWFLAIIGIITLVFKYPAHREIYLLMFIPFGWMLFITFTEAQSRYRYQSMPSIILLAGIGVSSILDFANYVWKSGVKTQMGIRK